MNTNSIVPSALLVWWATNTRAAAVLAARANELSLPVVVVRSAGSPELGYAVRDRAIIIDRPFDALSASDFQVLLSVAAERAGVERLVLAPTSEYLLDWLADHAIDSEIELELSVAAGLPYRELSSKAMFSERFQAPALQLQPRQLSGPNLETPFVAKPRVNVINGKTLAPFLVNDAESVRRFEAATDAYFAQEYVPPPSYYICGYRNRFGVLVSYFQRNLLQEPHGKSIAHAELREPAEAEALRSAFAEFLTGLDYHGPAMVEFRGDSARAIELNPRFWGPLLLSQGDGLRVVDAFFEDQFGVTPTRSAFFQGSVGEYFLPSRFRPAVALDDVSSDPQKPNKCLGAPESENFKLVTKQAHALGGDW